MNLADIHRVWKNSFRLFFAPLWGAFKGAIDEIRRVDRDVQAQRLRASLPPGAD
jgi:hypothetical protein